MKIACNISSLFKEYKKHLDPSDVDYDDTEAALRLVLDAASHANEMMRKLVYIMMAAFILK